jgi:geranylgeranyl diphosphate synthase type I
VSLTRSAPDVLHRARDLVDESLHGAVERLSPELRPMVSYHLGWSDADGRPEPRSGGKGVRTALAVLSAEAVGAGAEVAVAGAVAVDLVHNFSLVHDDLIDNDAERRHRPTVWAVFGAGQAVIVGDALLALAQETVLDAPCRPEDAVRAARCLAEATSVMVAGQALDMAFGNLAGVSVDRCLAMEAAKTGALLGCASSIGAILGGAPLPVVEALRVYGVQLGMAFQAVDDLLGIWGDPVVTGKPAWSDLRERKKSLPVTAACTAAGTYSGELVELLARAHLEEPDIARAAALVELGGGRDAATSEARRRLALALAALDAVPLDRAVRDELVEVAEFVVGREH